MLLAIDIGNTHTVIGVYAGILCARCGESPPIGGGRRGCASSSPRCFFPREPRSFPGTRLGGRLGGAQLTKAWMQAIKDATGARSLVCNAETAEAFSTPITPTPHEIGADRVADCGGGRGALRGRRWWWSTSERPHIEVIDRDGRFRSGVIAPGVQTSANALFTHGAQLPDIALGGTAGGHRHQHGGRPSIGYHVGRPTGWTGWCAASSTNWAIRQKVIATGGLAPVVERYSYHRRGEHRATLERPAPYRRSRPRGTVERGCLQESRNEGKLRPLGIEGDRARRIALEWERQRLVGRTIPSAGAAPSIDGLPGTPARRDMRKRARRVDRR